MGPSIYLVFFVLPPPSLITLVGGGFGAVGGAGLLGFELIFSFPLFITTTARAHGIILAGGGVGAGGGASLCRVLFFSSVMLSVRIHYYWRRITSNYISRFWRLRSWWWGGALTIALLLIMLIICHATLLHIT